MKRGELTNEYLSSFCLELSMLLQMGCGAYDAVLMLYDDEPDEDEKTVLNSIIPGLEKGLPLSEALGESGYFPHYLIAMTEAGEKTGRSQEALQALSEYYDRQERLYKAIKRAVLYPSVLLVLMVAVVIILIVSVLPIFNGVFIQLGMQAPPLAVKLMQFGGWLTRFCAVIAAVAGVTIIAAFLSWRLPVVRGAVIRVLSGAFGDRGVFRKIAVSRVISVMALATASGIDPEGAMELAASAGAGADFVKKRYDTFMEALRSGSTAAEAMLKAGFLSARNSRMLSVGARSGMMDTAMAEIAARCERDTQEEIDRLVGGIEPALVIISSVIVGAILLMIMLPLISIMSSIG